MFDIIKNALGVALGILLVDAFGFFAWVLSGQLPADGCYLGTITAHILRAIVG